jgi:hypothetical protein
MRIPTVRSPPRRQALQLFRPLLLRLITGTYKYERTEHEMTREVGKHRADRDLPARLEMILRLLYAAATCANALFRLAVEIIKAVHGGVC